MTAPVRACSRMASALACVSAGLLLQACQDFERLSEECRDKNAVRRVSSAQPWTAPSDTRTAIALLAASPDLNRVELASNVAGLTDQLAQLRPLTHLLEDPTADLEQVRTSFAAAEQEAASSGRRRPHALAAALAYLLRERQVANAIPELRAALERRQSDPTRAPTFFFLMVQNALWTLLDRPALPAGGLVHERVFLIEASRGR